MSGVEAHVAIGAPPRGDISIIAAGGHGWLTFHPDGKVTADPDMAPDDQARAIIGLMVENGWLKYAAPWQDISTAPKDGTVVDLWVQSWFWTADGEKQVAVSMRVPDAMWFDQQWTDRDGNPHDYLECFANIEFTHWMPLPAPPETKP